MNSNKKIRVYFIIYNLEYFIGHINSYVYFKQSIEGVTEISSD